MTNAGRELPDWIKNRPKVEPHLVKYWRAFLFLNHSRPRTGFGPGAIPLSEIREYLDEYNIRGDDRDDYIHLIRALDTVFLRYEPPPTEGKQQNG